MSDVKSVIALLCKHLKLLYGCELRNEHFRLAKFNETKEHTVSHFWHLLYSILKEDESIIFDEDLVNYVKLNLAVLEYNSLPFYALPCNMTSGSRELLLAFGWLVTCKDILDRTTKKKVMQSCISKEFHCLDLCDKSKSTMEKPEFSNVKSVCKLILWYAGKIRHNFNIIAELSQEWSRIMTKIHEDTHQICGLPHLSVGDIKLIHDIQNANDGNGPYPALDSLKESVALIETQKRWHNKNKVFWDWMGTVIDEREKHSSVLLDIEQKQSLMCFLNILERNMEKMVKEIKKAFASGESVEDLFGKETDLFCGLPRFIFQAKTYENDVKSLLNSTSHEITLLEEKYRKELKAAKASLESLSKKMTGLRILDI